jgi:hypothetical protein
MYIHPQGFTLSDETTPWTVLNTFPTDSIIQTILTETNRYADEIRQLKPHARLDWTPVSLDEVWTFLDLYLFMAIVRKHAVKDYWSTSPLLASLSNCHEPKSI